MMVVFLITFVITKNGTEIQNFSLSQIYNSTSWAMNYQRIKIQKTGSMGNRFRQIAYTNY